MQYHLVIDGCTQGFSSKENMIEAIKKAINEGFYEMKIYSK